MKPKIEGLVVATVTAFDREGRIDWESNRRLFARCNHKDDVAAIFVNGHAGEGSALTQAERIEIIRRAREWKRPDQPLFAGAVSMSTAGMCEEARVAEDAGADIVVVFPPPSLAAGGTATSEVPYRMFKELERATARPLSIFQMPLSTGLGFRTDTLVRLVRDFNVVAVKEGSDTISAYERNLYEIKAARPEVAILPSSYDFFLAQVALGADGILSGLGSLTPRLLAGLWDAAKATDLARMREVNRKLYPIVRAIYGDKIRMHMHTRIKTGLNILDVIDHDGVRGPLIPTSEGERAEIAEILRPYVSEEM